MIEKLKLEQISFIKSKLNFVKINNFSLISIYL